jgi:hypothetical protein
MVMDNDEVLTVSEVVGFMESLGTDCERELWMTCNWKWRNDPQTCTGSGGWMSAFIVS